MKRRTHLGQLLATSLAMAASALPGAAWSAGYPERPITLVVPFTAGGPTDTIARIVAEVSCPPFFVFQGSMVTIEV